MTDLRTPWERVRRRVAAIYEIARPFAYTASVIPVVAGGALAWVDGRFNLLLLLAALAGGVLLHTGTNIVNEIYDVRHGIDAITSPRASHAIVKGHIGEAAAYRVAVVAFILAALVGDRADRRARLAHRAARRDRSGGRLLLHGASLPVQVPGAGRAPRLPADGAADDARRLLRRVGHLVARLPWSSRSP